LSDVEAGGSQDFGPFIAARKGDITQDLNRGGKNLYERYPGILDACDGLGFTTGRRYLTKYRGTWKRRVGSSSTR
jgi:hypothetical protein